jgi:glycosyltransferase 2 family protein
MNKKRTLMTALVVAVLCLLIYLQVHAWKKFDWSTFWDNTSHVYWPYIVGSVLLTYFAYALRAVRWRIFLKPLCETTTVRMLAPQFIGFAGLALLGRPGEMIRPYLVARKENLTFTSQVGVWVMERIFDMGAVAVVFVFLGIHYHQLGDARFQSWVHRSAIVFFVAIIAISLAAVKLRRSGYQIADRVQKRIEPKNAALAHSLRGKIVSFTDGLQVIADTKSFLQLAALSIGMWWVIAAGYWLILNSYSSLPVEQGYNSPADLNTASIMVLMVAAMFGSLLQLPGVGGGSQLATINVLSGEFGIKPEVAVSCGMLIWLCTFMAVIPVGLLLAHRERLSLRAVAADEAREEAALN